MYEYIAHNQPYHVDMNMCKCDNNSNIAHNQSYHADVGMRKCDNSFDAFASQSSMSHSPKHVQM